MPVEFLANDEAATYGREPVSGGPGLAAPSSAKTTFRITAEPPRRSWRLRLVLAGLGEAGSVTVVQVLGGDRGEVVDGFVGPFMVEPGDPVRDGWFDVVAVAPGAVGVEQLGLEQADLGLGQGVVIGIADSPVGAENLCHLGRYLADTRSTRFVLGARRAGLGLAGDGMIFGLWA
jgi:hypothetical protein